MPYEIINEFSVNFSQGLGNLAAGTVVLIISERFRNSPAYTTDPFGQADYVWRIVLMFGAVPALFTYYWRMKMPETARYTALIAKNLKQAAADMTSVLDIEIPAWKEEMDALDRQDEFGLFSMEFFHRYGRELLGTTMCWLVVDIGFYSLNLFMKQFFGCVGWFKDESNMDPLEQTYKFARIQAIITVSGTLPGYFFTVIFIDKLGRIRIQLVGFTMMTIFMLGLAGPYNFWSTNESTRIGFAIMYAIIFFFANFGPNSTTFILPIEIFPTRLRSTCHGISGAVGKIGAIIGVVWFLLYGHAACRNTLLMFAGCNLVGVMFTLALPETKGMSLEDITGEIEEMEEQPIGSPPIDGAEFIHSVIL